MQLVKLCKSNSVCGRVAWAAVVDAIKASAEAEPPGEYAGLLQWVEGAADLEKARRPLEAHVRRIEEWELHLLARKAKKGSQAAQL